MRLSYLLIYFLSNLVFADKIEVNSIKIEGNSVIEDETIFHIFLSNLRLILVKISKIKLLSHCIPLVFLMIFY